MLPYPVIYEARSARSEDFVVSCFHEILQKAKRLEGRFKKMPRRVQNINIRYLLHVREDTIRMQARISQWDRRTKLRTNYLRARILAFLGEKQSSTWVTNGIYML